MESSAELKSAVLRLYEAMAAGDPGAIGRFFSRASGVLAIGSDPAEWWAGHDAIAQAFAAQLGETGAHRIVPGELSAWVEGTVGWAVDRRRKQMPDGKELTIRETTVWHEEDGEWKIVQFHASLAVSNEEAFG
jgi:ketosteroid isomerase-like protein